MGRNKMSSMRATLLCLGLIILLCLESPVSGEPKDFLIETEADSNDDAPLKLSGFEENPNNERPASGSQETPGSDYCTGLTSAFCVPSGFDKDCACGCPCAARQGACIIKVAACNVHVHDEIMTEL